MEFTVVDDGEGKQNVPVKCLGVGDDLDACGYRARVSKGDPEFLASSNRQWDGPSNFWYTGVRTSQLGAWTCWDA